MITPVYGRAKLVPCAAWYNGYLWMGGYSIRYDQYGNETGRTPVTWNIRVTGDDLYMPPGYEDLSSSIGLTTPPPAYSVSREKDGDENDLVPSWHLLKRFKAFCDLLGKAKERKDRRD